MRPLRDPKSIGFLSSRGYCICGKLKRRLGAVLVRPSRQELVVSFCYPGMRPKPGGPKLLGRPRDISLDAVLRDPEQLALFLVRPLSGDILPHSPRGVNPAENAGRIRSCRHRAGAVPLDDTSNGWYLTTRRAEPDVNGDVSPIERVHH